MPREEPPSLPDTNSRVAAALRDLAAVQSSTQKAWGYKRAASAILDLDTPLERLRGPDGTLPRIKHVGPSSLRVVMEVLDTGRSATVEDAVRDAGASSAVETRASYREHFLSRAEVVRALRRPDLSGPRLNDIRGDLHMHSTYSDGVHGVEQMAEACRGRGYAYCAISDHSYGLAIAGGVSMAQLVRQHLEIDALNARWGGAFHVLKGIEANLRADGSVDMTPDELDRLDIVIASPHSALRKSEDQTDRLLYAVRQPGVHVIGHPRGRMYGSRPGVSVDWPRVFAAAAETGVALEIDGDPSRQDLDHTLAAVAAAAGCLIAVDSDAHATDQLDYAETAVAHARLAQVPPDRIINTWPLQRLLDWCVRRKERAR